MTEPARVVVEVVGAVEPDLDPASVETAVAAITPNRGSLRRLALALAEDPDLLTTGKPAGPPQVELLIRELSPLGSGCLVLPRCARCDRQRRLIEHDQQGRRVCGSCSFGLRLPTEECSNCGEPRKVRRRTDTGAPLCEKCGFPEPSMSVESHLEALGTGLDANTVHQVVREVCAQRYQREVLGLELDAKAHLLAVNAAEGSHRLVTLVEALINRGASGVAVPRCVSCDSGQRPKYRNPRGPGRCCRKCYDRHRAEPCSRCGTVVAVVARTAEGAPLCQPCVRADPVNHETCTECSRTRFIYFRDEDRALCRKCWRAPMAVCSECGKRKPCHFAATEQPRCEHCCRVQRTSPCSKCGHDRPIWKRTPEGLPLCSGCTKEKDECVDCGRHMFVASRDGGGPRCSACYRKHEVSFRDCERCGAHERLHHFGLCVRCAAPGLIRAMFADEHGVIDPIMQPVHDIVVASDPNALVNWIGKSKTARLLEQLAAESKPITHETLDKQLPNKAAIYLRGILVSGNLLPSRDEHLAALERKVAQLLATTGEPDDRKLLRSYATWHHLRKLRKASERSPLTKHQHQGAQTAIGEAKRTLEWLRVHGKALESCGQADIDHLMSEVTVSRRETIARFLKWCAKNGHAPKFSLPPYQRSIRAERIEEDQRWSLVKRLIHDEQLEPKDRFSGLLVLLYGQQVGRLSKLTKKDVETSGDGTMLRLGRTPALLPPPMNELALRLTERQHHRIRIADPGESPWLLRGQLPGTHIHPAYLGARLKKLGLPPRTSRNTAMISLAAKVPSAVLSELLGIHKTTAGVWREVASASNARYGSHLARRG